MSTIGIDPSLLAKQATDTHDMVRFKQEMDGLKNRLANNSGDREKQLRKACQDFEAVFISKLWKDMKSTIPKEGYLHSKQEEQYLSMFDKEFAENMSRAGGIGLADMIYDQLSEKLKETSREALSGGVQIEPPKAEPIALKKQEPIPLEPKQPMTLEEWGGSANVISQAESVGEEEVVASAAETAPKVTSSSVTVDADVQAQLDALARRLETERMKSQLLGTMPGQGQNFDRGAEEQVGRKIAKIG